MFVGLLMVGCGDDSTPSGSIETPKAIDLDDKETREKILAEAIDFEILQHRDDKDGKDLFYNPKKQTPYTGWVKEMRNEKVKSLAQYKSGKADGPWTEWDENGHKKVTAYFKEGERDGLSIFYHKDGTEAGRTTYKDGEKVEPPAASQAIDLDDPTIDLDDPETRNRIITVATEAFPGKSLPSGYTGWVKGYTINPRVPEAEKRLMTLFQCKDGIPHGLSTNWHSNGQKGGDSSWKDGKLMSAVGWKPNGEKCPVTNVKDGNGVVVSYKRDGTELFRSSYKDGEEVED